MKRFLIAVLVGVIVLSLTACDDNSYSSSNSSEETIGDILGDIGEFLDNTLDKDEDTLFTMAGIEFTIPSYYNEEESLDDESSFYYRVDNTRAILLNISGDLISTSEKEFNEHMDEFADALADSSDTGPFNSKDIILGLV